jgi:hypothetical protein
LNKCSRTAAAVGFTKFLTIIVMMLAGNPY